MQKLKIIDDERGETRGILTCAYDGRLVIITWNYITGWQFVSEGWQLSIEMHQKGANDSLAKTVGMFVSINTKWIQTLNGLLIKLITLADSPWSDDGTGTSR